MKIFKTALLLCLAFLLNTPASFAQNTMYHMDRMPLNRVYNPAIVPEVKFFIGLPAIGGVTANAYNSGFNYNDLDYFIDNLHNNNYNPDEFTKKIGKTNHFLAEANTNLLSFGFKLKEKGYLSFHYSFNAASYSDAEADIVYLLSDFNDISEIKFPVVVDGISLTFNSYLSMGVSYSRKINENLTLGITPKINSNMFGIKTDNLSYTVERDVEGEYNDISFNQTFEGSVTLGLPVEINEAAINGDELDLDEGIFPENWDAKYDARYLFQNPSFSVDLGATYELGRWMFSASLLNLGGSKWKKYGYQLNGNIDQIKVKESKTKLGIPTRLYLGAANQFSPKWNYAVLLNSNFFPGKTIPSATVSLNGAVGRMLSTSVSYTAGYAFDNLGAGLRLRFLPGMDFFFVTDNIIQAFKWENAKRLTASAGISLSFGVKEKSGKIDTETIDN
ncbi:hypothetical protein SAMN05444274_101411 [Mariniphaga anaerophila]|uniref:DUF5723 domain-containing protein n=1 Tax=Mariniphaga anaerophila TaxID=1484053 RepID=A0A1M4TN87_9BACT|nr:DUF5723 family protein [Mariniphaga anaerophila]SHE45960.1 hypothetical protein SAMN05444274_101411 [Mariniphaga anaerophila]